MSTTIHITETAEVLAAMMVEDTGRHFLDSGDAYGREYERAQAAVGESGRSAVEFYLARPKARFGGWRDEVWPVLDSFHHLNDNLTYVPELQALFEAGCDDSTPWMAEAERFAEKVTDDKYSLRTINTYNYDTIFDETLQWVEFSADFDPWLGDESTGEFGRYIMLQIHRGADVRGGYTKPRIFRVEDSDYFGRDEVEMGCSNTEEQTALDGSQVRTCGDFYLRAWGGTAEAFDGEGNYLDTEGLMPVRPEDKQDDESKAYCPRCGHEAWIEAAAY